jgi:hypothetical protein
MHKFYETVTVAGKGRYLIANRPQGGIKQPQEFSAQQVEERLSRTNTWKSAGWKTCNLHPQLTRDNELENVVSEDLNAVKEKTYEK